MIESEFNEKVKKLEQSLLLDIAIIRYDLEEIICTSFDKVKLLELQSKWCEKATDLKLLRLKKYNQLSFHIL